MSMPKIPDINPEICVDVEDALSVLIASIGFEELGLAHIINAEGEKIQSFLGTLEGQEVKRGVKVEELEKLDKIVNKTLDTVIKKELILLMKLETADEILDKVKHHKREEFKCEE